MKTKNLPILKLGPGQPYDRDYHAEDLAPHRGGSVVLIPLGLIVITTTVIIILHLWR